MVESSFQFAKGGDADRTFATWRRDWGSVWLASELGGPAPLPTGSAGLDPPDLAASRSTAGDNAWCSHGETAAGRERRYVSLVARIPVENSGQPYMRAYGMLTSDRSGAYRMTENRRPT